MNNAEALYHLTREMCAGGELYEIAEALRDYVEALVLCKLVEDNSVAGFLITDMLNAVLRETNWQEITESFREE